MPYVECSLEDISWPLLPSQPRDRLPRARACSPVSESGRARRLRSPPLIAGDTVAVDRLSAEAGPALLDAGGDFADGVIVFEGRQMRGEVLYPSTLRRFTALRLRAGAQDCRGRRLVGRELSVGGADLT